MLHSHLSEICTDNVLGNYAGEYSANVLAPKGEASIDWSAAAYA